MDKLRIRWISLGIFFLVGTLILTGGGALVRADSSTPDEMLQRAWRNAREAGSYQLLSDINQTLMPRAVPEMIGQQEVVLNLSSDGAVLLPDQAYLEMRMSDSQSSSSVVILRDTRGTFLLQDGELKPVENTLNLAAQSNDPLGYLAAADQVTLLDPLEGHPSLTRYGFVVDGPRYAEYIRQQAEAALKAEPGAPQGLTVKPALSLQALTGQGELWVNQAGLPVRLLLDLILPEVNDQYAARIAMTADFSSYGEIASLPTAVQGADGVWKLQGSLPAEAPAALDGASGLQSQFSEANSANAVNWWAKLASIPPLRVSPSAVILFVVALLVALTLLYYRRNPRRCYRMIVFTLIPIFILTPILQSTGVVRFMERRVEAAREVSEGTPELLRALGIDLQEGGNTETDDSASSKEGARAARAESTPLAPDEQLKAFRAAQIATSQIALQQESSDDLLQRCGQGEPGVDSDSDGLADTVELCLGTSLYMADTDQDGIPDQTETNGFDLNETHWDSNPLQPDSNSDGISDTLEWSVTLTPNGQASTPDLDNDSVPNLWDEDDDGDNVPDQHDLSPDAFTGYTTNANLSIAGSGSDGYASIEIQIQPEELTHLRYSTTALDWPHDHKGNVKDLDESIEDLRLHPFLIVSTNVPPSQTLGEKYGFRSWLGDDGKYVVMAPLSAVEDRGAVHSFYAKIMYAPGQTADIQWQAQMVWMAEMQSDRSEDFTVITETRTLHEYQDSFRVTGLSITKDQGYEAAVIGTLPSMADDLDLFRILLGMNDTYKTHVTLEGQESGETALEEIASRFAATAADYHTFDVDPNIVEVGGPVQYGHMDAAVAGIGSELVPDFLGTYDIYYGNNHCQDTGGNPVNCASLIIAYESSLGVRDLADLPGDTSGMVDLSQLHVNLADVPLLTTRGVQMHLYEEHPDGWQMMTAARMLELIEQRYSGVYDSAMRDIYPDLEENDVRFIAYLTYLWATSPSYTAIMADGQALVDEAVDEAQLATNRALTPEQESHIQTALDYVGMGTGIAAALAAGGSSYVGWALNDAMGLWNDWAKLSGKAATWNLVGVGLSAASTAASMVMGVFNAICAAEADLGMCQNEDAWKIANAVVQSLGIIGQVQATVDMIIKAVKGTLEPISKLATAIMVIGVIISLTMTWVSFVLTVVFGGLSNPVVWRNALAEAIITTVYLIVMFIISCIPVIGQIIAAIMAIIDALFALFTWLFADKTYSIATALLGLFYLAEVCTNVGDASFGEFDSSLLDPELGLVGGNTLTVTTPFEGALYEEAFGNHDDLEASTISGRLTDQYLYYSEDESAAIFPAQDMTQPNTCWISDTIKYCSNTAGAGYLLSPKINGIVPVKAVVDYTIIWAEFGLAGAFRYSTNTWEGVLPEETDIIKPEFMYMDILPVNMTDLWNWSELTNFDPDGDGLSDDQELALATSGDTWDTDGDSLSDYYEWQSSVDYYTSPLEADTDGDLLNDAMEIRIGTFPNVADSDGDGLTDGQEVRHYQDGAMVGGWQITLADEKTYWVSSDPLQADADRDGLNDNEESTNRLSANASNDLVPALSLSVTPLLGVPGGLPGAYWDQGQAVEIKIHLSNGSPSPVVSTLTLDLPAWLGSVTGGTMTGDRVPALIVGENQLSWDFSGANALQTYEYVDTTITASTTADSGSGEIGLSLSHDGVDLHKTVSAVLDADYPSVAILAPADGAYLRGSSYIIGGAASDATTWVTSVELNIGGTGFQSLTDAYNAWAYLWTLPSDGIYSIQARATDVMDHVTTLEPVSVTVDNTPPVVTLGSQMNGNTVQLSGSATDNLAGVAWVRLSIDEQPMRSIPLAGTSWVYDWTVGEGAQGEHAVSVVAYDRSGNRSNIESQTVIIDAVAPASILTGGADPDVPTAVKPNTTITISGVADEGGHLPLPAVPADMRTGMDVFDDSAVWLGLANIQENDGGVLAAWAGDYNADRLADLAVGLPGPEGDAGQVAIIYGRAGGWLTAPDLEMIAESTMRYIGEPGARLGSYLAAAGDANGDNFSDLLVGERDSLRAFLTFGKPGPLGDVTLDGGQNGYRVALQAPANITGLAAAGDVNGDGYGDLLINAGETAFLIMGRADPWPETLDVAAEAAASFSGANGAVGISDVDNDQLAEWVTLSTGQVQLYQWDSGSVGLMETFGSEDNTPAAVSLGDVDGDGQADWIYSNGANPVLVYGAGAVTNQFSGYAGFIAAPGDVDGDQRADILLTNSAGLATLIHQPENGSLTTFATIAGVGGAANAPYASGADLNSDGSDDLLLIPSQAKAEAKGFDAPDFSSGFISPQSLPMGVSSFAPITSTALRSDPYGKIRTFGLQSFDEFSLLSVSSSDNFYVDDDGACDGHAACSTTIQAAVNLVDGGGDKIIIYPGVYAAFSVPADAKYDHLTVQGVSPDAVFVEGDETHPAVSVAADGVRISNLTVRDGLAGISLLEGAGSARVGTVSETSIDHVLAHSVQRPIYMNMAANLKLSDSTLVGNGVYPLIDLTSSTPSYSWAENNNKVPQPIGANGALVQAGEYLYALPGGGETTLYQARPQAPGYMQTWHEAFDLQHPLPTRNGTYTTRQGANLLAGGSSSISQLHSNFASYKLGSVAANGTITAIAISPTNGYVYVGGYFTKIGNQDLYHVAYWDGADWHSLGLGAANGTNDNVQALAFDPSGNLYVGGGFTAAGGSPANHVARWDGASWSVLGINSTYNGVNGPVLALLYYDGRIYIGGAFSRSYEADSAGRYASNLTAWNVGCTPSPNPDDCFTIGNYLGTNGAVRALAKDSSNVYIGGDFTTVDTPAESANYVAYFDDFSIRALPGGGLTNPVQDLAMAPNGHLYAVSQGFEYGWQENYEDVWEWADNTWSLPGGFTVSAYSVTIDAQGNVYTADNLGHLRIQPGGDGPFKEMDVYQDFTDNLSNWTIYVKDLAVDGYGQLYGAVFGNYYGTTNYGVLSMWAPASLYRRNVNSGNWVRLAYPTTVNMWDKPVAITADNSGNLYAVWNNAGTRVIYYYDSTANTWTEKAMPSSTLTLQHIVWANGLYALGQLADNVWGFTSYNTGTNTWTTPVELPADLTGAAPASLSIAWDKADHIYLLRADSAKAFLRYSLSAGDWEMLPDPDVTFTTGYGPAMALLSIPTLGNYFYFYATTAAGVPNIYSFGSVHDSDLRLTVDRTAFVVPDSATWFGWLGLGNVTGYYKFRTDIDTSNAWVGPAGANLTPALPGGASWQTSSAAGFVAPEDGLYRLGPESTLTAGYNQYKAVAHVYTSQSACAGCASGSLVWGQDAFATVREGVESGAARVLVHPGRYPQTFYLVSGVDVIGSGAENTIIEPPAGPAATLVTAEGVAHASLARLTLAGGPQWDGFLAEGGAQGLELTRAILRGLKTGVRLRGDSEVEIVNNTITGNTDGIVIEGTTPVNVRNTILAYNSGTGLTYSSSAISKANTYNDFWANSTNMSPSEVSLGSMFADPRFRNLPGIDLRLAKDSRLINKGAPGDPTPPGSGERVDIGYAEYNAAGFYVASDYSELDLNDGLTWGVDAFSSIQPALNAAAATMRDLQGALPDGGYTVAVDGGFYNERVSMPSHVRLVGSGADVTTIDAGSGGSAVTFDGVVDSEFSGFTVRKASSIGAGVEIKGASSGITIARNIIGGDALNANASDGIRLTEQSSAQILFNTIVGNLNAGVSASGDRVWADARNNILSDNATGLQAASSALLRNSYNLLANTTNLAGVTAGEGTVEADPAFAATNYFLTAASPAVDAADPVAEVPPAGGLRADLGYKELVASPLTLIFGPEIDSTITGNSGVAKVELGVVPVTDLSKGPSETLPTTWTTLTPGETDQPLYYWAHDLSLVDSGLYRVYSKATDAAGNSETEASDLYEGSLVVDPTGPTVSWGTPALPATTQAAAVMAVAQVDGTITIGSETRSDIASVSFNVSGPSGNTNVSAEDGWAWIPLPVNGSYGITVVAEDEAGNSAQQSATLGVNTASSVATVTNYGANSYVNSTSITLRGYVRFSGSGTGAVEVSVNGEITQATLESPGAQFSAWTAAINLPAGEVSVTVNVTPKLDNVPGTTTPLMLTLDTSSPTLNVATPSTGTTVNKTINFTGTASDGGAGLASVDVSVDGGYTWQPVALTAGAWNLTIDFTGWQDANSYPVQVRAVDKAGNTELVERQVIVDNIPPAGLTPVSFSLPVGQHIEIGSDLAITWTPPEDVSGPVEILLAVDQNETTEPTELASFTSVALDAVGDWYVHLIARDTAGNEILAHYGPWHVRDLANTSFSNRRQSIILDGYIDLGHNEWQASDLLGLDIRSGNPQELFMSADGQYIFLGWSGAWWTLNGVLWAYLDTNPGEGTNTGVNGELLPASMTGADKAVEIHGPGDGSVWTWAGAWGSVTLTSTDFTNGSSGDTEVRIPWAPTDAAPPLSMIAFALPTQAEELNGIQALDTSNWRIMALGEVETMELNQTGFDPWAMFPTSNGLNESLTDSYEWLSSNLDLGNINQGQPAARTVYMTVSSPQPGGAALCPGAVIIYDILLENPEAAEIAGLTLTLVPQGLSYQSITGASLTGGEPGEWAFSLEPLAAESNTHVIITAAVDGSLAEVESSINLTAGETALTAESNAAASVTHRVDGSVPSVSINTIGGGAITPGMHTFTGVASDDAPDGTPGSGLMEVEVTIDDGANWYRAEGTHAWSISMVTPAEEGPLTLQARAVDQCNLSGESTQTFTVDATAPEITWTAPASVTSLLTTISGTTVDPAPAGGLVETVEVQLDGAENAWQAAAGPLPPQNGVQTWFWTWVTPQADGTTHELRVRATDAAGNSFISPSQQTVVDTVAPQLTVEQGLFSLPLPVTTADPVLNGTVTDGGGVKQVDVLVTDPQGSTSTQPVTVNEADGSWVFILPGSDWAPGVIKLAVQAEDISGNTRIMGPYELELTETLIAGLEASNDGPKMVNEPVTFTASVTAGSNVTYTWDFGDGSPTVESQNPTHAYATAGTFSATVTASNSVSAGVTVNTSVIIFALSVEAGQNQAATEGQLVTVNATYTGPAEIAIIAWGDGSGTTGTIDPLTKTIAGNHSYADNGVYTVTVNISDPSELTAEDTFQVTVSNVNPTATLGNDGSKPEGSAAIVSFTDVTDPGSADTFTYSFDWNNNGMYEITDQAGASAQHVWDDEGVYTVRARVKDDDDGFTEYTTDVVVTNAAPTAVLSNNGPMEEGSQVTVAFTGVEDPGITDTHTFSFDWNNDGTYEILNQAGASATNTWIDEGTFMVRAKVVDNDGSFTEYFTNVDVTNVSPSAVLSNNGPVNEGSPAIVTFAGQYDPGATDTFTYSFDWNNDGTYEISDQAGASAAHTWPENGSYIVKARIKDNDLSATEYTTTVIVNNVAPISTLDNNGPKPEGDPVTVSFGTIYDPGADTHTYSFDWNNDDVYEIIGQSSASAQHIWSDNGSFTVQAKVTDDDGGYTEYTTDVTVTNVAPSVDAGIDAIIAEGSSFSRNGSFTDPGADIWTATVDYGDGSGEQTLDLNAKGFSLNHIYADDGIYFANICVTDDDQESACDEVQVTVNNGDPIVTASPETQTVQYSEAIADITFTAVDVEADSMTATLSWSSDGITFKSDPAFDDLDLVTLSEDPCAQAGGVNTCVWAVTGVDKMQAGAYTLRLTVTDKDGGATDKDVSVTVTAEEVDITFDSENPVAVQVTKPGGSSIEFRLNVCVSERDIPLPGDISLAGIGLRLVSVGAGGAVNGTPSTPTVEDGIKCQTFTFSAAPVNTYTVEVTVNGGYYTGANEDVLVVYDPSLGFTTGGGWFYWPGSADSETGYLGDRTNFGYTMKYNKKGTNIQGSLLMIRHKADGTIYRVKSNALYGLALGIGTSTTDPMGWASFSGKSTYMEPGWLEPIGNCEFIVYVEDHNQPGVGADYFWIRVIDHLTMEEPAKDYMIPLMGGNLVVPHQKR